MYAWKVDLACNEFGAFVVWEDIRDGELENHQIYFNRSLDGGETFLAEDLRIEASDPDGDTMSLEPSIAAAGERLSIAWYDNLNGAYDILHARSSDAGATFSDAVRLDSDLPGDAYSARPHVLLGGDADVWATWGGAARRRVRHLLRPQRRRRDHVRR